jgi:hypothetical protein
MRKPGEETKWNARQPRMMQAKQSEKNYGKKEHELQTRRESSEILGTCQQMSSPSLAYNFDFKRQSVLLGLICTNPGARVKCSKRKHFDG